MSSASSAPSPQLIFYGGKGGVGKTTCAAARAVIESAAGARVLVVSTDPAHSLGDALAVRLSDSPRPVPSYVRSGGVRRARGSLHAVELNARRAFGRWLARHRGALGDIVEHGTWLDRADVDALLDLPLPGIDELVGLLEIARLAGIEAATRSAYDIVVVDTAPTGHTVRLLESPDAVAVVAAALDGLQETHRIVRDRFARRGRPESADHLIALLAGQSRQIAARLRDARGATFHWVTLPEALSVEETCDAMGLLEASGFRIAEVIVNRMLPDGASCSICDRRRAAERGVLLNLTRRLGQRYRLRLVSARVREPRGVAALAHIGRDMGPTGRALDKPRVPSATRAFARAALSLPPAHPTVAVESLAPFRDAALLFIGGKGGVGKTTVAAGAALRLARADRGRRILLLSTDPAHSLADVLALPAASVGDEARTVPGGPSNLFVKELDAVRALAERRTSLVRALDEIAESFGAAATRHHGGELMRLAPPGIDELFGILSVLEAREQYPLIVVDMAPTGHALRLLEQPAAALEWVHALLRVLLKYRSLARPGQLARELVAISKSIRSLQARLSDAARTRVVVVTRAAELPQLETHRLMGDLHRLSLAVPALVINARTLGPGRCARCRATATAERQQVALLERSHLVRSRSCVIIQTPLSAPPPRGIAALEQWAKQWTRF